ncbi:MAG: dihydrodipicolinate synthase family protein [Acidobacteriota bacterium]
MATPRPPTLSESTTGVFVISATPFTDQGAVDDASLETLVDYYLARGVHGLTVLGMMGEAQKLTERESATFVRAMLQLVAGRVPVVVGVSSGALDAMRALAEASMEHGAAGVMVAPATGLKTDDQQMAYVEQVCQTLGDRVPIVYQDYPPTTGVFLSSSLFHRIVRTFRQVVMLKMEDNPGLDKITRIREAEARGDVRRISLSVGNGGLLLPQSLARGADGVMTGFGYPEMLTHVYARWTTGDHDGAEEVYDCYLPLVMYELQPGFGLAVRKEILRRRGAIRNARTRAPGPSLSRHDAAELDRLLHRLHARLEQIGAPPMGITRQR